MTKKTKKGKKKLSIPILLVTLAFIFIGASKASLLSPISVLTKVIPSKSLLKTEGRTNILLIGIDQRGSNQFQTGILTDTIILASIPNNSGKIALVSVPRDLWVEYETGYYAKINEIYAFAGREKMVATVEKILGIPIHYHIFTGFDGFIGVIDALGGVEVEVLNTFDDYLYPIPGMENDTCGIDLNNLKLQRAKERELDTNEETVQAIPLYESDFLCRFEHIHFEKGIITMDGQTALKYARSRHSTNPVEGTDFARARRQQQVILSTRNKLLSIKTILNPSKISELYNTYKQYVETDISLLEINAFLEVFDNGLDLSTVKTAVLSNNDGSLYPGSGLLISPIDSAPYQGRSVLIARDSTFSNIRAFVQKFIFQE